MNYMQFSIKKAFPILSVFLFLNVFIISSIKFLESNFIDSNLLLGANIFFLLISLISMIIQLKGMHHKNPNVFVRSVMGGMMVKFFCCIIAIVIYVYASGASFNKRGIFIAMFFYLIYLATEVFTIMKLNKKTNA